MPRLGIWVTLGGSEPRPCQSAAHSQHAPLEAEFQRGSDVSGAQGVTGAAPSRGGVGTWGSSH